MALRPVNRFWAVSRTADFLFNLATSYGTSLGVRVNGKDLSEANPDDLRQYMPLARKFKPFCNYAEQKCRTRAKCHAILVDFLTISAAQVLI